MRKSVTYLIDLRKDVRQSQFEAHNLATDLETSVSNILTLTPEMVRLDYKHVFKADLKDAREAHRELGKQLALLKSAALKLQEF
jgi:hypothetical protein